MKTLWSVPVIRMTNGHSNCALVGWLVQCNGVFSASPSTALTDFLSSYLLLLQSNSDLRCMKYFCMQHQSQYHHLPPCSVFLTDHMVLEYLSIFLLYMPSLVFYLLLGSAFTLFSGCTMLKELGLQLITPPAQTTLICLSASPSRV